MGTEGTSHVGGRSSKRGRRIGLLGLVAAVMLAVPATSLAATPELFFNFPAAHGYTLLGTVSQVDGHAGITLQIEKAKLPNKHTYDSESYAFSGFAATYSASKTKASVSANLGSYGTLNLEFSGTSKDPGTKITCPGSRKKTTIDKGLERGKVTGSISFDSQISYFGTISGHSSKSAFLLPASAALATRRSVDLVASEASSGSSGILACFPSATGKITYLNLVPAGASGLEASTNQFFAARFGSYTDLNATDTNVSLSGGPDTERSITVEAIGNSYGKKLFSFSGLSSGTATAGGPYFSGSASYHETTPCENSSAITYGSVAGAITANFAAGGSVTYGGAGTVGEMDTIPPYAACDNAPPGAPG